MATPTLATDTRDTTSAHYLPGTRLGPYEILELVGLGGMGEVYRARDTRLDRVVAIKMLPRIAALDPMLRLRVEQEARTVAAISHPHICALFDIGREGEIDYFVMGFLEGDTLADRMAQALLPIDLVLKFGAQIAGALAAAHRHGAVHCDLKPANIMLTRDGVKLLDFGIAQLRAERAGSVAAGFSAELPTVEAMPLQGTCAGTLHYMAPEQLRGSPVDGRTDIFALGAVLYQMLAGRRPFEGETSASVITTILHAEPPPLESLPSRPVPPPVEHVIRTCLAKDPDDRWQSARDVERELSFIAGGGVTARVPRPKSQRRRWPGWAMLTGAFAASLVTAWWVQAEWDRAPIAAPAARVRFNVERPAPATLSTDHMEARVSPNGRHLAFVARQRGTTSLWVRSFDVAAAREIAATDGASQPLVARQSFDCSRTRDPRHRRFNEPEDEERLLAAASPHLHGIIIALLETACRVGEILNLQWRDVALDRRELIVRAEKAKTRTERLVPISPRLMAVLQMRRNDPAGDPFGPEAYVSATPSVVG